MMRQRFCESFGIAWPVVQAPMGGASCPELAAAVSNAGGLGMLALSWSDADEIRRQIAKTASLTQRPFGANLVLAWDQHDRLAACLDSGVGIVSFFWGDPAPYIAACHSAGALVIHTIADAASAKSAEAAGADAIVAQGWEAGGHVLGQVATLPLTRAVVQSVQIPVLAAGGISDGAGLAAALALGAAGAWIGTRFLCTREAPVHREYQNLLLAADETSTAHTTLFDGGWPNAPHRVLRNSTLDAWERSGRAAPESRPREGESIARQGRSLVYLYDSTTPRSSHTGDIEAMSLWAGQGVAQVREIESAATVVTNIVEEADQVIRVLAGYSEQSYEG